MRFGRFSINCLTANHANTLRCLIAIFLKIRAIETRRLIPDNAEPDIKFACLYVNGILIEFDEQIFDVKAGVFERTIFKLFSRTNRFQDSMTKYRP